MNVEPDSSSTLRDESSLLQGVVDPLDRVTSHGQQKAAITDIKTIDMSVIQKQICQHLTSEAGLKFDGQKEHFIRRLNKLVQNDKSNVH